MRTRPHTQDANPAHMRTARISDLLFPAERVAILAFLILQVAAPYFHGMVIPISLCYGALRPIGLGFYGICGLSVGSKKVIGNGVSWLAMAGTPRGYVERDPQFIYNGRFPPRPMQCLAGRRVTCAE